MTDPEPRPGIRVEITPRAGQSETSVTADLKNSLRLWDHLRDGGTEKWISRYRWIGPVKFMVAKEVGPPPWRWPTVAATKQGPHLHFCIGWRMTAFRLHVMWALAR